MAELPDDPDLHTLLSQDASRFAAPAVLRASVLAEIRSSATPKRQAWLSYIFGAEFGRMSAAFATGIFVAAFLGYFFVGRVGPDPVLYALAADHARAAVTATSIEVPSSDRHTVKPWLSANLGYSPAVIDMADADFPLLGGRRGYLGGVPLAVMVYRYKTHEIDVYAIRPGAGIALPRDHASLDGYHVTTWSANGIGYVAISDVEADRLDEFSHLLKGRQSQPG
jgi:anti-sigma factor RsiW